ncbi:unnamed protein product [Periconia digitata]|uniref:Uncharacterized protein n=1 Tax=Periconia digitata TaxID=1303443 RepID=A0A9W4UAV3_9PLEO|nr:unnamed protein product [Periconia digitata]
MWVYVHSRVCGFVHPKSTLINMPSLLFFRLLATHFSSIPPPLRFEEKNSNLLARLVRQINGTLIPCFSIHVGGISKSFNIHLGVLDSHHLNEVGESIMTVLDINVETTSLCEWYSICISVRFLYKQQDYSIQKIVMPFSTHSQRIYTPVQCIYTFSIPRPGIISVHFHAHMRNCVVGTVLPYGSQAKGKYKKSAVFPDASS